MAFLSGTFRNDSLLRCYYLGDVGRNNDKIIAWATTLALALISLVGNGPSTYRFAIVFLAPLVWGVYALRHRLAMHTAHFGIFCSAVLFHSLGAFGAYKNAYFGIDFDTYVHFYFGIAGGLIVARALHLNLRFTGWQLWTGTILLILGFSAIHELIEFASTLALGPEKGMLKINSPDKFDTQKDLLNNLLGNILALGLYSLGLGKSKTSHSRTAEPHSDSAFDRASAPL